MENLFNLIFDNLWLVVIIFGVISSLFGGDKKKKQEHRPVLDLPTMRQEEKPNRHTEVHTTIPTVVAPNVKEIHSAVPNDGIILEEQLRKRQEMRAKQVTNKPAVVSEVDEQKRGTIPSYSKSQLVNGIIMAEVLGPPRAKRTMKKRRV